MRFAAAPGALVAPSICLVAGHQGALPQRLARGQCRGRGTPGASGSILSTPLVVDDTTFIGSADGRMYALE
jgi:hypothetical protein